ncbi:ABC transporter permease [Halobellus clavatus]|jgi:peptide/nickel transport system permease protein|nr:ABC transporter permease [Halobellus clavatus]
MSDATADESTTHTPRSGWEEVTTQLRRNSTSRWGMYIVLFIIVVAIWAFVDGVVLDYYFAERFWYSPITAPPGSRGLLPPVGITNEYGTGTWAHPLGTDHRGRDILVRLVYGSRIAIQIGIVATGVGATLGTIIGAVSGYYGGWIDDVLQRTVETFYAIPFIVLMIAIMSAFGRGLWIAIVGVSVITTPIFARLIRSEVLSVREEEYIEAAKAAGVRDRNIIRRHVIPNSLAPVLVQATLQIGVNILIVAALSFLGFGAQPPTPSWGAMLAQSRTYMLPDPWFSVWPGLAILVTVVGFNLVGDGLRDAFDPRLND